MERSGPTTSASVTWIDRPPFWLQRTRRIWAAGYGEPYPFVGEGRRIGRVIMTGPDAGFYPNGKSGPHDREALRREKEQNRQTKW